MKSRILYLGDDSTHSTSLHRADALRRCGYEVEPVNPRLALPRTRLVGGVATRVGLWPFAGIVAGYLRREIGSRTFDVGWVDGGAELSPRFLRWLRQRCPYLVNYNVDDPFSPRYWRKWSLYRRSLPLLDLAVVVRPENLEEARMAGARRVGWVYRSYDPIGHAPNPPDDCPRASWKSEVVFVGSWMPERGPWMCRLLELGVPLTIFGDHWQKAPEWTRLQAVVRGRAVYGRDYVNAIQQARVALGLVSRDNRDLHTQRSAEVPYIGGAAFCCERTVQHESMYRDGEHALFWSSPEECAHRCGELLRDEEKRRRIVHAARDRVVELGLSNDEIVAWVIASLQREQTVFSRDLPPFGTGNAGT